MANTSKNKRDRPATLPDGLALPQEQEIEKAIEEEKAKQEAAKK